jgi:hypothetical protein
MSRTMFDQSTDRLARQRPAIDIVTQENITRLAVGRSVISVLIRASSFSSKSRRPRMSPTA